ncbi:MAG: transposase [Rubrivivax sp.]|nr:transposase [Rubrivivax sp.]
MRRLWVGRDRTQQSLEKFFALVGEQLAGKVEFACPDMWRPYLEVVARHCPQALNILDRFHSGAKLNKARDEVRAGEARRMLRQGCEPVRKNKRWCLLKRPENSTGKQDIRPRELLAYKLKSLRACLVKEEFELFWEYDSPAFEAKFLDAWCKRAMRSPIEPVKRFARTVRTHRELLRNDVRAKKQFSSVVIEGLNNKAKVTLTKAYGHRTFRIAELSPHHVLGRLPGPRPARSFF